jgi:hypothetical protein
MMNFISVKHKIVPFLSLIILFASCSKSSNISSTTDDVIIEVNPAFFLQSGLAESITKVSKTLSNGSTVECYKIVSNNTPTDHVQGPWLSLIHI